MPNLLNALFRKGMPPDLSLVVTVRRETGGGTLAQIGSLVFLGTGAFFCRLFPALGNRVVPPSGGLL